MKHGNGSIFLIDDNDDDIHFLDMLLSEKGYRVEITGYSEHILTVLSELMPDCIIIDINIPLISGIELCRMIKSESGIADIPVIFISNVCDRENVMQAFCTGGTDYMLRPFRIEEVLAKVRNHMALSRMKRRLDEIVNERTSEFKNTNALLLETVDEYKKILKDLQDNETLLLTIALNMPNAYLAIIEKDYTIGFASGQEFKKNGFDPWRLVGLPINRVFREQTDFAKEHFSEAFAGKESAFEILLNDQYLLYRTVPLPDSSGEVVRVLTVAENITESKRSENSIRESLREKETLLKEIHHRVKNNLQIVSSLLNLQTDNSSSTEFLNIVNTLQNRIFSMSLVHEKLYHYKQFSKINFREYIKELTAEIRRSFGEDDSESGVLINLNVDNVYLSIERAIPSGLILNELIMNSFKHAFKTAGKGVIDIGFTKNDNCDYVLSVKDNGDGLPFGFDLMKAESTGMILIRELVSQIHGSLVVESHGGTEFKIVFGASTENHKTQAAAIVNLDKKKILIVEDERIISTMLKKIIEAQGYWIIACVTSGKEAIRYALETQPDLILMDIVLEDEIDGVEAARVITGEIDVPVIFLTGNSDAFTLNAARNIRPYDMLTKPVRKKHLVEIIKSALS